MKPEKKCETQNMSSICDSTMVTCFFIMSMALPGSIIFSMALGDLMSLFNRPRSLSVNSARRDTNDARGSSAPLARRTCALASTCLRRIHLVSLACTYTLARVRESHVLLTELDRVGALGREQQTRQMHPQ